MTIVQQIRKRDGRVVPFHENKIADAINKAFEATYKPGYEETAAKLAHEVASVLEVEGKDCPEVEHIQDIVERVLMDNGLCPDRQGLYPLPLRAQPGPGDEHPPHEDL
mgnify:CR=1 FL=1